MKKLKLILLKGIVRILIPKDIFVGKHYGGYTQKYEIVFGKLDSRGVLQGVIEKELF